MDAAEAPYILLRLWKISGSGFKDAAEAASLNMFCCRFVSLQTEATRLADKAALIGARQRNSLLVERYKALMSPVMLILERNMRR
jgi:hypothetical protein